MFFMLDEFRESHKKQKYFILIYDKTEAFIWSDKLKVKLEQQRKEIELN